MINLIIKNLHYSFKSHHLLIKLKPETNKYALCSFLFFCVFFYTHPCTDKPTHHQNVKDAVEKAQTGNSQLQLTPSVHYNRIIICS